MVSFLVLQFLNSARRNGEAAATTTSQNLRSLPKLQPAKASWLIKDVFVFLPFWRLLSCRCFDQRLQAQQENVCQKKRENLRWHFRQQWNVCRVRPRKINLQAQRKRSHKNAVWTGDRYFEGHEHVDLWSNPWLRLLWLFVRNAHTTNGTTPHQVTVLQEKACHQFFCKSTKKSRRNSPGWLDFTYVILLSFCSAKTAKIFNSPPKMLSKPRTLFFTSQARPSSVFLVGQQRILQENETVFAPSLLLVGLCSSCFRDFCGKKNYIYISR